MSKCSLSEDILFQDFKALEAQFTELNEKDEEERLQHEHQLITEVLQNQN